MKNKFSLCIALLLCMTFSIRAQQLYIGANYHPHDDKNLVKIKNDIRLMKEAGFNVTRLGHLAWDSYEPAEGIFDFEWFDHVMDLMAEAGIDVILDIPVRPAPLWLHKKHPSISITDANGNKQYPNHRYMEDVGDPMYQHYAMRFVDTISKRYAKHPALLAFGIDNESGDGLISYSETVRQRFIKWLQNKYTSVDNLNEAWNAQRWSRWINQFDEVGLPVSGNIIGAPERVLDFRRFISNEINLFLFKVIDQVNHNAPNALLNTNAWYYSPKKYFDYAPIAYSGKMTRQGCGFYPGPSLITNWGVENALFGITRIQYESQTPFWCSEFTTMTAVPGSIRKSAYTTLMYGNQLICGWTWQSMHGGEEQYLEGMMDWDGMTNRKYNEYKQIASEFKKIEKYFPYKLRPEVGLAFSFPSQIASSYFPELHDAQVQTCFNIFCHRNMDVRMLDINRSTLDYKLLFIPGVTVMDKDAADKIRQYIKDGGTVIMTANSAMTDETGKVFSIIHPGLLNDVFGIRIASFEETEIMNEISPKAYKGKRLGLDYKNKEIDTESARFDVIETKGAKVLGRIHSLNKDYPIITCHEYGKGKAIYVGLPAREDVLSFIVDELIEKLSISKGPEVPNGIMARNIDENHVLYFNTTGEPKTIHINGKAKSLLFEKEYNGTMTIAAFEPEFVEIK